MSNNKDLYKYYCITEGKYITEKVKPEDAAPIVCKNNASHTISMTTLTIIYKTPTPKTKENLNATEPPDESNDETEGYSIGSKWSDVLNKLTYSAIVVTTGSAEWIQINSNLYGTGVFQSSSEGTSATTSDSYKQKLRLTTNSLILGTYKITWYYEWQNADKKGEYKGRVRINDTATISEHLEEHSGDDHWASMSGFYYAYSMSGIQNIDIDYANGNKKDSSIRRARIEIVRSN